jgi:hypothetical protein
MKKVFALTLVACAFSVSAFASETYFNFPTITSEFKKSDVAECQAWLAEKTAKYGDRILASQSGCKEISVRVHNSSSKAPQSKSVIKGTVVLESL